MRAITLFFILNLLLLGCFFSTVSCKSSIEEEHEYLSYINDATHGLVKEKRVGDLIVQVKYLPSDLLAWKELHTKKSTAQQKDSISTLYDQSITFLLSVSPDSSKGATDDILYRGVSDEQSFKQRVSELNFDIERMLKLNAGNKEYYPALAVMENTYGTSSTKNFYIVFSAEDKKKIGTAYKELDLVFTDELFATGINHFVFEQEAIEHIPSFNWKTTTIK